jgi:hypothetical protein
MIIEQAKQSLIYKSPANLRAARVLSVANEPATMDLSLVWSCGDLAQGVC